MEAQQRWRHWLRAEHGSQGLEAAGAALAAALLVLALLLGARGTLGPSVERAFECAAAVIGGGGADCGGGAAATTPGTPTNTSQDPPAEEEEEKDCNVFCHLGNAGKQVLGVGKGIGEGVVDLAKGVWTLGSDAFKAATGDQATRDKYAGLVDAFRENPWETTKAIAGAVVEPIVTDWKAGRYGEAVGRSIFEGASVVFGPKGLDKVGKLGKLDDIARVADKGDEIADAARTVNRLPCVGAAPTGKGPGLAKPLLACDVPKATLGHATSFDYKKNFFEAHPELEGQVVVHHAIEQQVLKRYPGLITEAELHSLENLRGIPKTVNADVHLSQIRRLWNEFYRTHPNPTKQDLLDYATEIDRRLGQQFTPPIK